MNDTTVDAMGRDRRSWLIEPCAAWCAAKATHREHDLVDDRLHFSSWRRFIVLPTVAKVEIGRVLQHRQLIVYVEQHVSEDQPRVIVTDAHTSENEHRLTVEEATNLGAALLHGVSIINGDEQAIHSFERAYTAASDNAPPMS